MTERVVQDKCNLRFMMYALRFLSIDYVKVMTNELKDKHVVTIRYMAR